MRTRAEIKEQLRSMERIVRDEYRIMEQIRRLRAHQTAVTVTIDGLPKGGAAYTLDDYAADLDALERRLMCKLEEERAAYAEAEKLLDLLTGLRHEIMVERYLMLKKWEQIAVDHDKTYRYMQKLHRKALDEIAERECMDFYEKNVGGSF